MYSICSRLSYIFTNITCLYAPSLLFSFFLFPVCVHLHQVFSDVFKVIMRIMSSSMLSGAITMSTQQRSISSCVFHFICLHMRHLPDIFHNYIIIVLISSINAKDFMGNMFTFFFKYFIVLFVTYRRTQFVCQ